MANARERSYKQSNECTDNSRKLTSDSLRPPTLIRAQIAVLVTFIIIRSLDAAKRAPSTLIECHNMFADVRRLRPYNFNQELMYAILNVLLQLLIIKLEKKLPGQH